MGVGPLIVDAPRSADGTRKEQLGLPAPAAALWEHALASQTPMALVDDQGELRFANQAFSDLLARAPDLRRFIRQVAQNTDDERGRLHVCEDQPVHVSIEAYRAGCRLVFAWPDEQSPLTGIDPLTGLGNRACFESTIAACRYDALLLIDLDRFKQVNDTLGHSAGDTLLKLAAKRLRKAIRAADVIIRLGGDEFAIFLDTQEELESAAVLTAERVVQLLSGAFLVESRTVHVGASVGIAVVDDVCTDHTSLYRHADMALYAAKAKGGGAVAVFESTMETRAEHRRRLEADLRPAIALGQLSLRFQPLVHLPSQRLRGFEALARWEHPTRGVVGPQEFIPVAEEIGVIFSIGEWVLRTACRQAVTWPGDLTVAVNVSARQLDDPSFVNIVEQALRESGLPPGRLELEITESVLMTHAAAAKRQLTRLVDTGVSVALDDFGTGYSSLSYLSQFPFKRLKIDRSFVHRQQSDPRARDLIRCILALGKSLNMHTLAEGIETEQDYAAMTDLGCREAQGWLFGRPLDASALDDYLREHDGGYRGDHG